MSVIVTTPNIIIFISTAVIIAVSATFLTTGDTTSSNSVTVESTFASVTVRTVLIDVLLTFPR